jgi:hypothetical protein
VTHYPRWTWKCSTREGSRRPAAPHRRTPALPAAGMRGQATETLFKVPS